MTSLLSVCTSGRKGGGGGRWFKKKGMYYVRTLLSVVRQVGWGRFKVCTM